MTQSTLESTPLGRTGLQVSRLCIGTAAWGVSSPVHELTVSEADAVATAGRAFTGPVTILDTSNNYGDGESERRIGAAIRQYGLPDGFIIQTKLDRDPATNTFDAGRMRTSLEESLERLGLDRVPILYLHDPEHIGFDAAMSHGGPVEALQRFRDEGYADHIGISGGPATMLQQFVETGHFDALITHNRFTLVDRTAERLLDAAAQAGVGVMNAAVYGGGLLANWPRSTSRYHYTEAHPELLAAVDAMGAACDRHGVPLRAAALQFSTRDTRVSSTICGVVSPNQIDEAVLNMNLDIPDTLWDELNAACPDPRTWIND